MNTYNQSGFNKQFIELAKKLGFNPVLLKEIIGYRNLGYNNTRIAEVTGISRITVNNYIEKIKQHETQEAFLRLVWLALGLYIGKKILDDVFGK